MPDNKYILEIKNLEKSFGDKKVLKGVDLKIPQKRVFGFVGKNGAGKTTTMKMVLGLMTPNMICRLSRYARTASPSSRWRRS